MEFTLDILCRVIGILFYLVLLSYWQVTAVKADKEKPKANNVQGLVSRARILKLFIAFLFGLMLVQLGGWHVFSFPMSLPPVQILGVIFVIVGVLLAISARRSLGANWAHAAEYQIKKNHELITNGIYRWIRHPIYTGFCFVFIGGELIAQSYILALMLLVIVGGYDQAKREEKILSDHFGKAYKTYMQHSKMFLPFLW